MDMVASHRPQRHPGQLGRRRREPQRQHPVRAHCRRGRRARVRCGDPAGPRLRQRPRQGERGRLGHRQQRLRKEAATNTATAPKTVPFGLRWAIERTNSRLSNFGQIYAATPTADPSTDSPDPRWPSPCCSQPHSSTGETAGAPHEHLSAHVSKPSGTENPGGSRQPIGGPARRRVPDLRARFARPGAGSEAM